MSVSALELADSERDTAGSARAWFEERKQMTRWEVSRIDLDMMELWRFGDSPKLLHHRSGKFFSVLGVAVEDEAGNSWSQPIIEQSEIGVLGLAMRLTGSDPEFLIQCKVEPGNINGVQLAPTVQATFSNYTRVHAGRETEYLPLFKAINTTFLLDQVQPEHGAYFLGKFNRNIVVVVDGDIEVQPGFRWLSLSELIGFLADPNAIGMSLRSVLACAIARLAQFRSQRQPGPSIAEAPARFDWTHRLKWSSILQQRRCGLDEIDGWSLEGGLLRSDYDGRHRVIGVDVAASGREVGRWQQPIFDFQGVGLIALLIRRTVNGPELLVHAATEAGYRGFRILAPTYVSYGSLSGLDKSKQLFGHIARTSTSRTLYDTILSEEGGRFRNFQNEYRIIDVTNEDVATTDAAYQWAPLADVLDAVGAGCISMELRSLLVWLGALSLGSIVE